MGNNFMGDGASCVAVAKAEEVADLCCISEHAASKEMILLVEDEAFVREVTCEVLRSAGYRVLSARDSGEAERRLEASRAEIDLLITDIVLPGENGRVLAEKLRKRDEKLRVLLVTGYAEQVGLLNNEAIACLVKPFSSQTLLGSVRRVLDAQNVSEVVRICREWAHVAQT
jgi:two-component system, cell cycle sensor histidine kinase and response regulator CckA